MCDKILPVLVSSTFVIILFIIGRYLDGIIKSREVKRNWYLKVIIDPNFSKIEKFYSEILLQTQHSINLLHESKEKLLQSDYTKLKISEIEKFKNIKRKFEFEFVMLVQTNNPEIAELLSEHLRGVEDLVTKGMDNNDIKIEDFVVLESEINNQKYIIFQILFIPLEYIHIGVRTVFINLISKIKI